MAFLDAESECVRCCVSLLAPCFLFVYCQATEFEFEVKQVTLYPANGAMMASKGITFGLVYFLWRQNCPRARSDTYRPSGTRLFGDGPKYRQRTFWRR